MLELDYGPDGTKYRNHKLQSLSVEAFVAPGGDTNAVPTERFIADIDLTKSSPRFPNDYFEDVAVIVQPTLHVRGGRSHEIAFFINHAELADDAWIAANLWVCDFVAFPGFPPWHDKLAQRPILRTGTISSDPRVHYSDEPIPKGRRVAYEAFSFGGSSGSPVFAPPRGIQGGAGVKVEGFRDGRLIGVNAGHLMAAQGGHSGVSYFIKSSAILELLADG